MKSYKQPTFQERTASAADAKKKALEQLRARPKPTEEELAARNAARLQREQEQAEKAAAKKAAEQAAAEAEAAKKAAVAAPLTEAELKARRDARYAARKNRK